MQSDFRAALVHLCSRVVYPLIRILIRAGVSAGEFKSIVDSAYARVGLEHLAQGGGPVTHSRLAIITGINRTALADILSIPPGDDFKPRSGTQLHRASRVLDGWHEDADFVTRSGKPLVLSILGERGFEGLAQRYSGGLYFQTILAELVRLGAVERVGPNRVRALRQSLESGGASAEEIFAAGDIAGSLMSTLDHNLSAEPAERLTVRAAVVPADAARLPLLEAQVERRAEALIGRVETLLRAHSPERRRKGHGGSEEVGPRGEPGDETLTLGAVVFTVCEKRSAAPAAESRRQSPVPPGRSSERR